MNCYLFFYLSVMFLHIYEVLLYLTRYLWLKRLGAYLLDRKLVKFLRETFLAEVEYRKLKYTKRQLRFANANNLPCIRAAVVQLLNKGDTYFRLKQSQ